MLGRSDEALAAVPAVCWSSAPDNARAQAGLKAAVPSKSSAPRLRGRRRCSSAGRWTQALAMLKKVLGENPSQKDAQALQRRIEESQTKVGVAGTAAQTRIQETGHAGVPRCAAEKHIRGPVAHLRNQLRVRPRCAPRPEGHDLRSRHLHRGRGQLPAGDQPAGKKGAQRQHHPDLPQSAQQVARLPGTGGEELLSRQRRREADAQFDQNGGQDARRIHRRAAQSADHARYAGGDPAGGKTDRGPGPRRARSHPRTRGARGHAQQDAKPGDPVSVADCGRVSRVRPARGRRR